MKNLKQFIMSKIKVLFKINWLSWLLCIASLISIIILFFDYKTGINKNGNTIFDESIISGCAFMLLIITAVMQNKDLKLQRSEMEQARIVQEQQKDELKESNEQLIKNIRQTKFFELQRIKEQILNDLVYSNSPDLKFNNYINKLIKSYLYYLMLTFQGLDDKDGKTRVISLFERGFIIGAPQKTFKEYKFEQFKQSNTVVEKEDLLNIMIDEVLQNPMAYIKQLYNFHLKNYLDLREAEMCVSFSFLNSDDTKFTLEYNRLYKYHQKIENLIVNDEDLKQLYSSLLLNEEKLLYFFIDQSITIEKLNGYAILDFN